MGKWFFMLVGHGVCGDTPRLILKIPCLRRVSNIGNHRRLRNTSESIRMTTVKAHG